MISLTCFIILSLVKSQTQIPLEIPCIPVQQNMLYSPSDGKCYLGSCPSSNSLQGTVQTAQGTITICQNYPPNSCPVHCQSCTGFGLSSCIACAASSTRSISSITINQVMAGQTQSCGCIQGFIEQVPMQVECMGQEVMITQDTGCLYSCGSCKGLTCQTCLSSYMINQTCDCQPGFYKSANFKSCLPCDQTCGTCITYPTYCLSCIKSNKRNLLGATCPCVTGYQEYPIKYPQCQQACPNPPNQCIAGTNICIGCYDNVNMQIVNNQCQCYPGNYMGVLKQKCWACHYSCATCSSLASCDTCNPASYRKLQGLCYCQSPTFDVVGQQQCVICNYTCATCVALTYCLTCPPNTNRIPLGFCKCIPYTFGEDYVSNVCQAYHYSCYLARLNGAYYDQCEYCAHTSRLQDSQGRCPCKVRFYDVGVAQCQPCEYSCLTCSGPNNTDCLTCNSTANRILQNGQCVCKQGYGKVNDILETCQLCNQNCKTCSYVNACTTCTYNGVYRYLDTAQNTCLCIHGYYDKDTVACGVCDKTCMTCNGPNYNQCTDCNSALCRVLLTNVCICMAGYYENYGMCILCYYACQTCDDVVMNHCTTCPSTRHPIRTLPNDNFFQCQCNDPLAIDDGFSLQCQSCYYACLTCSGPQSNNCLTCYTDTTISREYINQSCVCPIYWYDDGSNEVCQKCDYTCETCFDNTNQGCITCSESLFRLQQGNACSCNDGYFEDFNNFICAQCYYSCATCDLDPTNCTSCDPNSQRILTPQISDPSFNQCQCSAVFPNDQIGNPICQLCHYSCKTCTNNQNNTCTSCDPNRYLFADKTGSYCNCNPHSYDNGDSQCAVCSDLCQECSQQEDQCTSCSVSDFRQLSGTTCVCASRLQPQNLSYFEDEYQMCQQCHYSCTQCNGVDYQNCTTCNAQDNRQQNGNQCDCLFNYIDLGNRQCDQCNYSCLGCQNTQTYCLACPLNSLRIFQNNLCQCPQGYFDDGSVICQQCDITCQTCSGLNSYCLSCDSIKNRYLFNNSCSCLSGYYDSGSNCSKCHYSCSSCFGPILNDCSICPTYLATLRVYQNGQCPCLDGFYDDGINQKCNQCSQLCLTCQNSTSCLICKSGLNRQINNGQCQCITKYFEQNQYCYQCSPYCLSCMNQSDQCNLCDSNLFRQLNQTNKQCECLQGYYDSGQLQCQVCSYKCQTCNQFRCLSCSSNNFRIWNSNQCDCIDGTFDNGISVCVACDLQCATCLDGSSCKSCNLINKRQLVGFKCLCIQGYFENNSSICSLCDQTCLTCENTSNNCTQCYPTLFRELQNNNCICMSGRYNNNGNCLTCSTSCLTCDTTSTYCTSCPSTRYLTNNQCQCNNGYYDTGSQFCQICNYTCSTCTTASTNCLTCNTVSNRIQQSNQCPCQNGFYDNGSQICIQCNQNCQTCSSSQVCTSCSSTNNRILVVDKCLCLDSFYDDGSQVCKQCDPQCVTCKTYSTQCTSCNITMTFRKDQSFNYNQCPCLPGFYDDGTLFCKKCSYKCLLCENLIDNCTFCNTNLGTQRLNIIPSCPCQNGYYDDGIQINCLKCNQRCQTCESNSTNCIACQNQMLRNSAPLCSCLQGYYEDQNFQCQQCLMKCLSCSNQMSCLTCQPDRIGKNCNCAEGYYEANQIMCIQCDRKCQTCLNDSLNCQSCKGDRINPPDCTCQDHYYDNLADQNCQICDQNCYKCNMNGCLDCAANRILNLQSLQNCDCPINSISYSITPWCSNCETAVVKSQFSDDLTYITIQFEYNLKFNFQMLVQPEEYCSQIFQNETLDKLGNIPCCNISNQVLNIYLGFGSQINGEDEFNFKEYSLNHQDCANPIKNFILTNLQAPTNLLQPNITLSYPSNPISPCYDIPIQIISQSVNAQRNLFLKWGSHNQNNLQSVINQANQFQYTTLTLPQFSLQELQQYQFYLQITNIFNATYIQNFTIETLSYGSPQIQILNYQKSFYRRFPIKINLFYQNYLCQNQQNIAKNGTINISLQQLPEKTIIQTNSSILASGNIVVIIPAKTLDAEKSYVVRAIINDENQLSNYDYSFKVELSPLFVEIVGGAQVVDYKQPINVIINALDMDYNTTQGILYQVECIQLSTKQKCQDTLGNTVQLNNTFPQQYLKGNLFNPFTILQFNINCTKGSLKTSNSGIFIVLESDYPNIQVNYSQSYQQRLINVGDDLQFTVVLPQDTKEALISVALIYNYDTVAIRSFQNEEIQFSIWDMFINFTFLSQIAVRIQVHDLRYFLPSLFALNLNMNLPPIQSIIKITPQEGDSLFTQFTISVQNAKHINTPILYRYAYYESHNLYQEDIEYGQNNNLQVIQDFSIFQQLNFIMESGNITILVSVSDSLGSIGNYTQQIIVSSFQQYMNRTQNNCSNFLSSLSYQSTQQLLIISIELIKLYRLGLCQSQIISQLNELKLKLLNLLKTEQLTMIQRISQGLSQIMDFLEQNSNRFLQQTSQIICYNKEQQKYQFINPLQQIEQSPHENELISNQINIVKNEVLNSIIQQNSLIDQITQLSEIGDSQSSWQLKYNLKQRINLFKIISSIYKNSIDSKLEIFQLIIQLQQSFQYGLQLDGYPLQIKTDHINSTLKRVSNKNFMKLLIKTNFNENEEESLLHINKIISIIKFKTSPYLYQQNNSTEYTNLIDSPLVIPIIYSEQSYQINEKLWQKQFIINSFYELNECQNQNQSQNQSQSQSQNQNQNTTLYELYCFQLQNEVWVDLGCQMIQYNQSNKLIIACQCGYSLPITLTLKSSKLINTSNETQIIDYQQPEIRYEFVANQYLQYILGAMIVILPILQLFNKSISKIENIKSDLSESSTHRDWITSRQQHKYPYFTILKNLHEITRIYIQKFTYINRFQRTLLLLQNISVIALLSHVLKFVGFGIPLSVGITMFGQLLFQIITKILEGFHSGPIFLKCIGYVITISIIFGCSAFISLSNIDSNDNQDTYVFLISLTLIYALFEPLIQFVRLKIIFQLYQILQVDSMNPVIHFVYYFFQDEYINYILTEKNEYKE